MEAVLPFGGVAQNRAKSGSGVMSAASPVVVASNERRVDPLDCFVERAAARAYLWAIGEYEIAEAVDVLQHDARRDGLIERIGQDAIQAILAAAFQRYRDMGKNSKENKVGVTLQTTCRQNLAPGDRLNDPRRQGIASTIKAFRYVLQHNSPEQIHAWLERRRPDERAMLRKLLHNARQD
jgi:hypothetical protein